MLTRAGRAEENKKFAAGMGAKGDCDNGLCFHDVQHDHEEDGGLSFLIKRRSY